MTQSPAEFNKCLDNDLRHGVWFLRMSHSGLGVGLNDPLGPLQLRIAYDSTGSFGVKCFYFIEF